MLIDAKLPKKYWSLSFQAMAYLRNRSPTRANDYQTPYEVFYGEKPNLAHIHPFGCEVSVHIPQEKRKKLDAKSWTGRLVGYLPYDKGYRVLDASGTVRDATDIIFDDDSLGPADPASTVDEDSEESLPARIASAVPPAPIKTSTAPVTAPVPKATGSGGGLQCEVANLEVIPGADMPARSTRSSRVRPDTA